MPRVSTEKLQAGMLLGSDVKDLSGRMLLKSGTEIQEKHLKVLRTWGVMGVDVEGDIGASDQIVELCDMPPEVIAAIEGEIEERFSGVDVTHPVKVTWVGQTR